MGWSVLTEPWWTVRRSDGSTDHLTLWQLADPDIIDFAHPRPDLNGAQRELAHGILQVIYAPEDSDEKIDRVESVPHMDDLREHCERWSERFELISGPARFLQEYGGVRDAESRPLDSLLLNGPGEQTRKLNKDFFVRRDDVKCTCPACVVLMLSAKQFYASGAGSGFRVSPRGGGPLTTLVGFHGSAESPVPLWSNIYINIMPSSMMHGVQLTEENVPRILPWHAPLRVSKNGRGEVLTTKEHADSSQVFFPVPARAEIVWKEGSGRRCDICGALSTINAISWKTAQYGVKYSGFRHPLTPYRKDDKGNSISLKPKTAGVSYTDWLAITLGADGETTPSDNIKEIQDEFHTFDAPAYIRAFGYQLDNASALAWHEAVLPFVCIPKDLRQDFAIEAGKVVHTARQIASALESYVKQALYTKRDSKNTRQLKAEKPKVKGDFSHVQRDFISETSATFYDCVPRIISALESGKGRGAELEKIKSEWLDAIRPVALRLFAKHAPVNVAEERDLMRIVTAHRKFERFLRSDIVKTFLGLTVVKMEQERKKDDKKILSGAAHNGG